MIAVRASLLAAVALLIPLLAASPSAAEESSLRTSSALGCDAFSARFDNCLDLDAAASQERFDELPLTFTVKVPEGFCQTDCDGIQGGVNLARERETVVVTDLSMAGGSVRDVTMSVDNFPVFGPRNMSSGQTIRGIRTTTVPARGVRDIFVGGNGFKEGEVLTVTLREASDEKPGREFRVSGRVVDLEGTGVPDRRVAIDPRGGGRTRGAKTDDDGNYSATLPAAGEYAVSVQKERRSEPLKVTGCSGRTRDDRCIVNLTRNRRSGRASFRITGCPLGASAAAKAKSCPIVVNDSGDRPDTDTSDKDCDVDSAKKGEQCTLRAAIEEANARKGKDKIAFRLRDKPPTIAVGEELLPRIAEPTVIDGRTQPGPAPVQLVNTSTNPQPSDSGASPFRTGLRITGGDTTVRGLHVRAFVNQIVISGRGGNVIEGNRLGGEDPFAFDHECPEQEDSAKSFGAGVVVTRGAPLNRIGGVERGQGNRVFGDPCGVVLESGGNRVQGNTVRNSDAALVVRSRSNLVGGSAEGAGNSFLDRLQGVRIEGNDNVIRGNALALQIVGARNSIGGTQAGAGNQLLGLVVGGIGNEVQGNCVGHCATGPQQKLRGGGILVVGEGNLIGGAARGAGNRVTLNGVDGFTGPRQPDNPGGIIIGEPSGFFDARNNRVIGNMITRNRGVAGLFLAGGEGNRLVDNRIVRNHTNGIVVGFDAQHAPIDGNTIAHNEITGNRGNGVLINGGTGSRLRTNTIFGNTLRGIDIEAGGDHAGNPIFGDDVTENDPLDTDTGPNELQNSPVLVSARRAPDGGVTVVGRVMPGDLDIEFFASPACDRASRHGEGARSVGFPRVKRRSPRSYEVHLARAKPGETITAIATDHRGNSSEFSNCVR